MVHNETGGYLVRTKSVEVNEGGVATGYAALDSVYLVWFQIICQYNIFFFK